MPALDAGLLAAAQAVEHLCQVAESALSAFVPRIVDALDGKTGVSLKAVPGGFEFRLVPGPTPVAAKRSGRRG